jgi:MFS family permease
MAGACIGSFSAGLLIKYGRKRAYIFSSVIVAIGVVPTLFLNVWLIVIGRLIAGVGTGAMTVIVARMIEENVPTYQLGGYGVFNTLFASFGSMTALLMGNVMPKDKSPELATSPTWRYIFGLPLFLSFVQIFVFLVVFP